ncbi:Hypoxanthine-guanine phosphoribosyltransferase isoform 2 [Schistosoma japonicum]|uniref:Hypoxanthine-guanine phosphoribosyltransferase isoform 2 n=1 Tax=Schistosoma japonicum TaxID=6182 RepID=A0A4Z2DAX6_SCHJA|nr:Hypoxanthine-guanine phosphoribosyltransferase isoform 2 [Schistosoma japonicum]
MERFRNKNVLIAEDLVDTGTSLTNVEEYIRRYNPTSVRTACLLVKRRPDCPGYQPDCKSLMLKFPVINFTQLK